MKDGTCTSFLLLSQITYITSVSVKDMSSSKLCLGWIMAKSEFMPNFGHWLLMGNSFSIVHLFIYIPFPIAVKVYMYQIV